MPDILNSIVEAALAMSWLEILATSASLACVILAIYRKPNIFRNSAGFEPGGKRIKTDKAPTTFETAKASASPSAGTRP